MISVRWFSTTGLTPDSGGESSDTSMVLPSQSTKSARPHDLFDRAARVAPGRVGVEDLPAPRGVVALMVEHQRSFAAGRVQPGEEDRAVLLDDLRGRLDRPDGERRRGEPLGGFDAVARDPRGDAPGDDAEHHEEGDASGDRRDGARPRRLELGGPWSGSIRHPHSVPVRERCHIRGPTPEVTERSVHRPSFRHDGGSSPMVPAS